MEFFSPTVHREHWPPAWLAKNLGSAAVSPLKLQQQKTAQLQAAFEQFADSDLPGVIRGNE